MYGRLYHQPMMHVVLTLTQQSVSYTLELLFPL